MNDSDKECVVCGEPAMRCVRQVPTRRTNRQIDLFWCQRCYSFTNPSGYRETPERLERDLKWNLSVIQRNEEVARELLRQIREIRPEVGTILEVGCGIGTTLKVARDEFDFSVTGYDINACATEWGRENSGLDLRAEFWDSGKSRGHDLLLCISCLEHVEEPRPVLEELARTALRDGSLVYISVPFLNPVGWRYLNDPSPDDPGTPFFDNDVHVTHFSKLGLIRAMAGFGLPHFIQLKSGIWIGFVFVPNPDPAEQRRFERRCRRKIEAFERQSAEQLRSEDCPDCLQFHEIRNGS